MSEKGHIKLIRANYRCSFISIYSKFVGEIIFDEGIYRVRFFKEGFSIKIEDFFALNEILKEHLNKN